MPLVQSIDGVYSLYQNRQGSQGHESTVLPMTVAPRGDPPSTDPADAPAQGACRQGPLGWTRKPVAVAREIMSVPVVTLAASAPLVQAWMVMRSRRFRHLPIVSDFGTLVGMISDVDLLHAWHGTEGRVLPPFPLVREVMAREVITATPDTPGQEIIEVMLHEHIGAVPILDDRHHPVGILTTTDILRALLNRAPLGLGT